MAGTAAAVSSTDALSPSTSSSTAWEFAVPLGPEIADTISPKRTSNESNSTHNKSSYRHRTPNGKPRSRTSSQPGSRRGSNTHDAYGRDTGPFPNIDLGDSHNSGQFRRGDYGSKTSLESESIKGDDNWIHRDKLARIESEELQQAAMRIQRQVRTGSKSSSLRGRSHDSHSLNGNVTTPPEQTEQSWPASQRYQIESPIPFESSDEQEVETERMNWDLRRPEEIAASSYEESEDTSRFYKSPGLKKSSSRIPVLASSPITVSPDQTEHESSTLQRSRTRTVGSGDEDGVPYSQSPKPGESPVVDSPEASPGPAESSTPPQTTSRPGSRAGVLLQTQGSPTKKAPAKATPTARKSSVPPNSRKPSGPVKQRATSASSMNKDRPVTRSGENRPPTSMNRPEGDPPWLATMYKPDPRLPPDQQLLPTHAKRMQQEQWEKEGKTPTAYDREFAPLAVRPDDELVPVPSETEKKDTSDTRNTDFLPSGSPSTWPLQPPKSPEPVRPGTSGTNYSTMPKVQTTPPIVLPSPQRLQASIPPPPEEPEKVEKGCGCCIVM
ncbi:hypothetical protein UA08_04128 [Talaromyces atroroseus]|uniref:TeaA receptor TeaR n=1 Tax=Talaromyces atroroseus TaxID=1441469 RepID=A0A1Q5Q9E1_TALAT|nr:hypothetical protein UA08_04128 [Talaromyces atroroseus]OKL60570.1 hypothetical protein UA08_04128 [Talaromyces atroroseus]